MSPIGQVGDSEFDRATAVRPTDEAGTAFALDVDAGWTVGPKPNGGYLLAAMGRAAATALRAAGTEQPHPLAASAHYVAAPDAGPAEVHTELLRAGRSASQVRATLVQGGRRCVEATFTLGTLGTDAPWWSDIPPVEVPAFEACVRLPAARDGLAFVVSIMDRVDLRLDPACLGFATGRPSGHADLRGWMSLADGRAFDPLSLLFALDALPPATFDLVNAGWVPTLQLTTYIRARPTPGPVRVRQRAQLVDDGRFDETCEIWDATGRLVAQATQLAAIRIPPDAVPPA
ncbi:MAG TPA: thioesterase family protein [Acidimicrobiales bacterium]